MVTGQRAGARLPHIEYVSRIPRIIHQIYLGSEVPSVLQSNIEDIRKRNPHWAHQFYDDKRAMEFITEYYGQYVLTMYLRINPDYGVARADLLRYLVLYAHGGVYIDVKSTFAQPIDEVVRGDEGYILSRWRNQIGEPHEGWGLHADLAHLEGGEFQQWHVIASPGHPFLRAVIERVVNGVASYSARRTGTGWIGVLRLTGPIAYTQAIMPILNSHPHRIVRNELDLGLIYSTLEKSTHQELFKKHYTENLDAVVLNKGLRRLSDRAFIWARSLKDRYIDR